MCTEHSIGLTQQLTPDNAHADNALTGVTSAPDHRPRLPRLTRRAALIGGAAAMSSVVLAEPAQAESATAAQAQAGGRRQVSKQVHDLTHPLTTSFPAFVPGEEATRKTTVTIEKDGYYIQQWQLIEHIGTHVDAPGHFTAGGRLATDLDAAELVTPAVVIDIAKRASRDPDTVVTVDDLRGFERRYGRIPRDAAVLMYSGWAARVGNATAYRNADTKGTLHFPGFAPDACEWLLKRRRIRSLGVDTLSIDPGNSTTFETHLTLTGADRYGLENLAGLGRLPRYGATVVVGLIPLEKGSGGPARVFAMC